MPQYVVMLDQIAAYMLLRSEIELTGWPRVCMFENGNSKSLSQDDISCSARLTRVR